MLSHLKDAMELSENYDTEFIWKWPQITHQYQIEQYKQMLQSNVCKNFHKIMVDGMGALKAVKDSRSNLKICGSAGINVWNVETVLEITNIFETLTPSAELSKKDLKTLIMGSYQNNVNTSFELVVQGNVDTLISADCLLSSIRRDDKWKRDNFYGIQDIKKHIFPIKIDQNGKTHILNSVELCLINYLPEICQIGINSIVVDARNKTCDYAQNMISIYRQGLDSVETGTSNMNNLKNKIKSMSTGGITVGNFMKGIKEE